MKQECEWCSARATYRVQAKSDTTYSRFACDDSKHRNRTEALVELDLGDQLRTRAHEAAGFDIPAQSGRG